MYLQPDINTRSTHTSQQLPEGTEPAIAPSNYDWTWTIRSMQWDREYQRALLLVFFAFCHLQHDSTCMSMHSQTTTVVSMAFTHVSENWRSDCGVRSTKMSKLVATSPKHPWDKTVDLLRMPAANRARRTPVCCDTWELSPGLAFGSTCSGDSSLSMERIMNGTMNDRVSGKWIYQHSSTGCSGCILIGTMMP